MDKLKALLERYKNLQLELDEAYNEHSGHGNNEIAGAVSMIEDGVRELERAVDYASEGEGSEG
jgi:hypothetical protein